MLLRREAKEEIHLHKCLYTSNALMCCFIIFGIRNAILVYENLCCARLKLGIWIQCFWLLLKVIKTIVATFNNEQGYIEVLKI